MGCRTGWLLIRAHLEMLDFGSWQGPSAFTCRGVLGCTLRNVKKRERCQGPKGAIYRWALVILLLAWGCSDVEKGPNENERHVSHTAQNAITPGEKVIVAMGNSLTEGLGVDMEDAWPSLLEKKLRAEGFAVRVINAGISGETSSGALSRTEWVLRLGPDIIILESGANDGLRGIDPSLIYQNLSQIIQRLTSQNIRVILAGMQIVSNLGETYASAFRDIYPRLAREYGVILIPFLLEGVGGQRELNQRDGIHPNEAGYRVVAETVYPYVAQAVATAFAEIN